jgi:hypothetical protein
MSEFQGDTFLTAYVWTHSSLNDARRKSHTLTLKAHAPPSKCARAPYVTHVPTYMHPCHIHRLPNPASRLRAAALRRAFACCLSAVYAHHTRVHSIECALHLHICLSGCSKHQRVGTAACRRCGIRRSIAHLMPAARSYRGRARHEHGN